MSKFTVLIGFHKLCSNFSSSYLHAFVSKKVIYLKHVLKLANIGIINIIVNFNFSGNQFNYLAPYRLRNFVVRIKNLNKIEIDFVSLAEKLVWGKQNVLYLSIKQFNHNRYDQISSYIFPMIHRFFPKALV